MLQENYKPIQLYARIGVKNNKPAVLLSKWITDPQEVQDIVNKLKYEVVFPCIVGTIDKVKFYNSMAEKNMIIYNYEEDRYYWNDDYLDGE